MSVSVEGTLMYLSELPATPKNTIKLNFLNFETRYIKKRSNMMKYQHKHSDSFVISSCCSEGHSAHWWLKQIFDQLQRLKPQIKNTESRDRVSVCVSHHSSSF